MKKSFTQKINNLGLSFVLSSLLLPATSSKIIAEEITSDLDLASGWNLVGVKTNVVASTFTDNSNVEKIFSYTNNNWTIINSSQNSDLELESDDGYWFKMTSGDSISYTGDTISPFLPSELVEGWNLKSLQSNDLGETIRLVELEYNKKIERAFQYNAISTQWQIYDKDSENAAVDSETGLWLKVSTVYATETFGDITVSFYGTNADSTNIEDTTLTVNGITKTVSLPSNSGSYFVSAIDNFGNDLVISNNQISDGDSIEFTENGQVLFVYGTEAGLSFPYLLDNVTIYKTSGRSVTETYQLTDASSGIFFDSLNDGDRLFLFKDGYATQEWIYDSSKTAVYKTMVKVEQESYSIKRSTDSTAQSSSVSEDSSFSSAKITDPVPAVIGIDTTQQQYNGRDDSRVEFVLLEENTDDSSLNTSFRTTISPYFTENSIVSVKQLKSNSKSAYVTKNSSDSLYNSNIPLSVRVIGGGSASVTEIRDDLSGFNIPLDVSEAKASALGYKAYVSVFATNYKSFNVNVTELGDELSNYGNFSNRSKSTNSEIYTMVRTEDGWTYAGPAEIIDRSSINSSSGMAGLLNKLFFQNNKIIMSRGLISTQDLSTYNNLVSNHDEVNRTAILSADQQGIYDVAFVQVSQTEAPIKNFKVKVVDSADSSVVVANAQVRLNGQDIGTTNSSGELSVIGYQVPLSDSTIPLSAIRPDYYRNNLSVETGNITDNGILTIALEHVPMYATITGTATNEATGEVIEGADVTLFTPSVLGELRLEDINGEQALVVGEDPTATYEWFIKYNQDGFASSRVLKDDDWTEIKVKKASEDGHILLESEILGKIVETNSTTNLTDSNVALAGNYELKVQVKFDINQDGITNVTESFDQITFKNVFNRDTLMKNNFRTIDASVFPANECYIAWDPFSQYSNSFGATSKNWFISGQSDNSTSQYLKKNTAPQGKLSPNINWRLVVKGNDLNGNEAYLQNNQDGTYEWISLEDITAGETDTAGILNATSSFATYTWGEVSNDGNISNDSDIPMLSQYRILEFLSEENVLKAFLETSTNGNSYLEEGIYVNITGVASILEDNFDGVGGSYDQTYDINGDGDLNDLVCFPITTQYSTSVADLNQNWNKVFEITDVDFDAPISDRRIRQTVTSANGVYKFSNIPLDYGNWEQENNLDTSFLRVQVKNDGYYDSVVNAVERFKIEDSTTTELESVSNGNDFEITEIPKNTLTINVVDGSNQPVANLTIKAEGENAELTATTDSNGAVTFEDAYIGLYKVSVIDDAGTYAYLSEDVSLTTNFGESQEANLSVSAIVWESNEKPYISNVIVSDLSNNGTVVISGNIYEYSPTAITNVIEQGEVAYGKNTDRDNYGIKLNGQIVNMTINKEDNGSFRKTVTLQPGRNDIYVFATNGKGTASTSSVYRDYTPSAGRVDGTILFDDDDNSTTDSINASGATVIVSQDGLGDVKTVSVESNGNFVAYGLDSSRKTSLKIGYVNPENDREYFLSINDIYLNQARITDIGEYELIPKIDDFNTGSPELAVDSIEQKSDNESLVRFEGRLGNYDRTEINGQKGSMEYFITNAQRGFVSQRPVTVTSSYDPSVWTSSAVDETSYFQDTLELPWNQNSIFFKATNVNGEIIISPVYEFVNNDVVLRNIELELTNLSTSDYAYVELLAIDGRSETIVSTQEFLPTASTETIYFDQLERGDYLIRVNQDNRVSAENSVTLSSASDLSSSMNLTNKYVNISWASISDFNDVTIIDSNESNSIDELVTNLGVISGNIVLEKPASETWNNVNDVIGELVITSKSYDTGTLIDSVSKPLTGASFTNDQAIIPFEESVDLTNGTNVVTVAFIGNGGEISQSIKKSVEANNLDSMTITMWWENGSDGDLHTIYFPEWTTSNVDDTNIQIYYGHRYIDLSTVPYLATSGIEQVQDLDNTYSGDTSGSPEHHTWAFDDGKVPNGTYLVYIDDFGSNDLEGVNLKINAPGLQYSRIVNFAGENANAIDPQPMVIIQVENNRVVNYESINAGDTWPDWIRNVVDPTNFGWGSTRVK